ncbi:MAG: OmpA family protein [Gammaproteobacteria bacterium]
MRKPLVLLAVILAVSLAVAGCKPKVKPDANAGTNTSQNSGADSSGVRPATVSDDGADAPGPMEGLLAKRTIYFDFDSSEIKGEGTDIVAAHAKYLSKNTGMKIRLEGHTDERGSREYNIGPRRTPCAGRAPGAAPSGCGRGADFHGELRRGASAAAGSDEAAWAKNRRVEVVYLQ